MAISKKSSAATARLINIDRAVHEIRCGRPVVVGAKSFLHPDFLTAERLKTLRNPKLVLTKTRGKVVSGRVFKTAVEIDLVRVSITTIQKLVSGQPAKNIVFKENKTAKSALELARIAELLPVAVLYDGKAGYKLLPKDIMGYKELATKTLEMVADAPLKLCDAPEANIKAFRSANGMAEHLAITVGKISAEPLVRIHSSCYTGDLLGSLTCDCGDQLRGAIKLLHENGGGVILYLMQEGRGIGLINKLKAYKLQESGLDTVDANEFLGFDDEERSFGPAALMLKKLGIKKLRLITNNPKKISGLEELGLKVTARVPMVIKHKHNQLYLEVKSAKSGHILK